MTRDSYERARQLRDSNVALALVAVSAAATLVPLFGLFTDDAPVPVGESVLTLSWWLSAALLSGYGLVHVLAAVADVRRFLDDHGTEYANDAVVFCHALGQRLFVLLAVGFALVLLAILGPGVGVPLSVLLALGLFGAVLLGPPVAIPMNRRVETRLAEYREG